MRIPLPIWFAATFVLAAGAAAPAGAAPAPAVPCVAQPSAGDLKNVSCRLPAATTTGRFRFKADFSGGHDDTMASIALTLNGEPLECAPGSKTRLMGEDGDVFLECRFDIAPSTQSQLVAVTIRWSHAQYEGFDLASVD
jgi:hypothetical protein